MQRKERNNTFVVNIEPESSKELHRRGEVKYASDGRVVGVSTAINRALKLYLGRI